MAWEDDAADWEKYANSDVEESSDDDAEAIKYCFFLYINFSFKSLAFSHFAHFSSP